MLFLESYESAKKRKAKIYGEILGYGLSCDAYHITDPSDDGVFRAMERAVKSSKTSVKDIDYICAHGTGTKENDVIESKAIKKLLGKHVENVAVSSIKSMLGHTMGAASAIGAVACCLAIKNEMTPPNINFKNRDPACESLNIVKESYQKKLKIVMNNSQAFGGNNGCLILGKI
jgi:3-oxoacyl-[acyl-carrier-protein] synthase II